ncbi:MAG TPA: DUF2244 domain-containing protein [Devosia sp.]|nr:DUF2244 domain-containing protein [Devosia sp.]
MSNSPVFSAILTPHRSLDQKGMLWVMIVFLALALVPMVFFMLAGAWPVIGFFGLDILGLWWALNASKKSGYAYEQVSLWPDVLQIVCVDPNGRQTINRLNPFWVRLTLIRDYDNQITHICISSQGRSYEIGHFLNPDDKSSFARVLANALARVKN